MKKTYKIFFLFIVLIFFTTFNPIKIESISFLEKYSLSKAFSVKKIEIENNYFISKKIINNNLESLYNKNIFTVSFEDIYEKLKKIYFINTI